MTDKTLTQVIAELEGLNSKKLEHATNFELDKAFGYLNEMKARSFEMLQIIRTLVKDKELLREALKVYKWIDNGPDSVASEALSITDPNQPWKG